MAGFDAVFSVEFFNRNAYVPLGAIAQATRRVRIGSGIANAFTRTPLMHAAAAMDLDELSRGRMVLGLGSATRRMNTDWYAAPADAPARRMHELVRLLRAAFAAARAARGFEWRGEFWNLRVPLYARAKMPRPAPPIWIAAVNPRMVRVAGETADALVGHPIATRRWHREVTLPGLRAGETHAGRAPHACRLAPYILTSLAKTREAALQNAKPQIGFYFTTALYHSILKLHGLREVGVAARAALRKFDVRAMAAAIPDALVDEIAIACTPDEARDRLAQWDDLCADPLFYAPSIGLRAETTRANLDAMLEVFAKPNAGDGGGDGGGGNIGDGGDVGADDGDDADGDDAVRGARR